MARETATMSESEIEIKREYKTPYFTDLFRYLKSTK